MIFCVVEYSHTGVHFTLILVTVSLLLRPPTGRTGGGQKVTAPPPYGRWARVPGGREEEQTYFLVGNN